ncbi:MAG: ParB/RepB/Spo0J family partition protein [Candidatus Kapaibacterium sp.]
MAKNKKIKPGLGKGLSALIPEIEITEKGVSVQGKDNIKPIPDAPAGSLEIDISKVKTNPYQPRMDFDRQALTELRESIEKHGLIQPITVRKAMDGYELVSGERRLRACNELNMERIPAYIMDVKSDAHMLELALIENIQRENLNPVDIANGYQRLIEECNYTQEQVARQVGKDRSTVTNFIRLLRLPEKIQEYLRAKEISMGHARAIVGLSSKEEMLFVGDSIIKKGLSVRAAERMVKDIISGKLKIGDDQKPEKKKVVSPETEVILRDTENRLRHSFGTQVKITPKSKDSGKIEIEFYSHDDFERIIDLFDKIERE